MDLNTQDVGENAVFEEFANDIMSTNKFDNINIIMYCSRHDSYQMYFNQLCTIVYILKTIHANFSILKDEH